MALTGSLSDIFLGDLIQLHCQPRTRARLTVKHSREQIDVYFDDGRLVHAHSRRAEGAEAVYELARWDTGDFLVEQGIAPLQVTIQEPWHVVLMEAMRLRDENMAQASYPPEINHSILQSLHEMLSNSGFDGMVAINRHGVILASELPGSLEPSRVGAIATSLLNLSNRSVSQLERGEFQQTLIQGAEGNIIITPAGENAVLVALADQSVNLGMAFLEARECAQTIAELVQ